MYTILNSREITQESLMGEFVIDINCLSKIYRVNNEIEDVDGKILLLCVKFDYFSARRTQFWSIFFSVKSRLVLLSYAITVLNLNHDSNQLLCIELAYIICFDLSCLVRSSIIVTCFTVICFWITWSHLVRLFFCEVIDCRRGFWCYGI